MSCTYKDVKHLSQIISEARKAGDELIRMSHFENAEVCGDVYSEEFLATYLLSHGLLFPPCKINESLWVVANGKSIECYVKGFCFRESFVVIILTYQDELGVWHSMNMLSTEIGKRIFFSADAAENSLKAAEHSCSSGGKI